MVFILFTQMVALGRAKKNNREMGGQKTFVKLWKTFFVYCVEVAEQIAQITNWSLF